MSRRARRSLQEAPGVLGAPSARPARRRGKRGRAAKREPASAVPWRCVVLAVDTAARSGWSVRIAGRQSSFGEADTLDSKALDYIVSWSLYLADRRELPLVLVLEAPFGGPVQMLLALGAARERWLIAWRRHGLSESSTVRVQPSTWRGPVLGPQWVSAPRAEVRAHEQLVAAAMLGERVRADEAAAVLIGRWAERAPQVGRVLERR